MKPVIKRVLFVFCSQEHGLVGILRQTLQKLPGVRAKRFELIMDPAETVREALLKFAEKPYDLIVAGFDLASEPETAVNKGGGLDLCAEIRKETSAPIILIVPEITNVIQDRVREAGASVTAYLADEGLPGIIAARVGDLQPAQKQLDVVFFVKDGGEWRYEIEGRNFQFKKKEGRLRIGEALVMAVTELSRTLAEAASTSSLFALSSSDPLPSDADPAWRKTFSKLGQIMMGAFCESNEVFEQQLDDGIEQAGGVENTRVRFVVDSHYPIAFEALFPPPKAKSVNHWLVQAPLYRHLRPPEPPTSELFQVGAWPKRTLIVCADTAGFVQLEKPNSTVLELKEMLWLQRECKTIEEMIKSGSGNLAKMEIRVLGGDGTAVYREAFLDALKEHWDIVHFAGHSYYENGLNGDGRGYLFVGPKDKPIALSMETVAPFLKNCRLLYLSSCQSASSTFAFEAVKAGVPAMVGYRWPVADRYATAHARLFYRKLYGRRSVERAFWSTQRAMHRRLGGNNVWASSMLVIGSH